MDFRLFPMKAGAPDWNTVPADKQDEFMRTYCAGSALPTWELALDGLTRSQVFRASETRLQPGYRADVVVYFPSGRQLLRGRRRQRRPGQPDQANEPIKLLGVAVVAGGLGAGRSGQGAAGT